MNTGRPEPDLRDLETLAFRAKQIRSVYPDILEGEFTNWRQTVLLVTPFAWLLTIKFVEEFLAVRALGMLVLLAATPLLDAAFLRPELSRLFLVTLVYIWIGFSMFWVGMPYTLRDQIGWVSGDQKRWRAAAFAGLAYGALLLLLPLTFGKPAP